MESSDPAPSHSDGVHESSPPEGSTPRMDTGQRLVDRMPINPKKMAFISTQERFIAFLEQQGTVGDKEMAAQNDAAMPGILNTMSNRVAAICVYPAESAKEEVFSGTVLVCRPHLLYMITVLEIRNYIDDNATIKLKIATDNLITLGPTNFHMYLENTFVGIRVVNPPPEAVQNFEEINFDENDIQDQQDVYTYHIARKSPVQMLTVGSVILNEEGSFDHNAAGYKFTHFGAPVVNNDGLLGICYAYSGDKAAGYYSAYSAQFIADEIDTNHGREFTTKADCLQHLRQ